MQSNNNPIFNKVNNYIKELAAAREGHIAAFFALYLEHNNLTINDVNLVEIHQTDGNGNQSIAWQLAKKKELM